jgi:hypothetical protein
LIAHWLHCQALARTQAAFQSLAQTTRFQVAILVYLNSLLSLILALTASFYFAAVSSASLRR